MIRDLFLGVASNLLTDALRSAWIATGGHLVPLGRLTHDREVGERLREMPFIYRDIEAGNVLSDYVDVEIETLDLEKMQVREAEGFDPGTTKRMRDRKKLLILGNAGIGKT